MAFWPFVHGDGIKFVHLRMNMNFSHVVDRYIGYVYCKKSCHSLRYVGVMNGNVCVRPLWISASLRIRASTYCSLARARPCCLNELGQFQFTALSAIG